MHIMLIYYQYAFQMIVISLQLAPKMEILIYMPDTVQPVLLDHILISQFVELAAEIFPDVSVVRMLHIAKAVILATI